VLTIDTEQEDDGRWVAGILTLPGVMAYGAIEAEAQQKAAWNKMRLHDYPVGIAPA
jgi:predicted RNase H-like HicB family nuclease